jgi:3-deoxy-D-manno-octulosonic-acid transferase
MFLFYNFVLTLLSPIWVPWMIWRSKKRREAPNWQERQGNYQSIPKKKKHEKRIWVHAVSLGEVIASRPFLVALRTLAPNAKIILSTTTSSGHENAREKLDGLYDYLVYFPIDLPRFQLRAMQIVRPDAIAVMETELWFNFLWAAKVFETKTFIVNGRMSDRAFKNSQKFRWFYRSLFKMLDGCLVQSETDATRYESLGAQNIQILGNTKFDEAIGTVDESINWRSVLGIDPTDKVIVIGSTRSEFEEELVQNAVIPQLLADPTLRVIHAPRHLETADRILASWSGKLTKASQESLLRGGRRSAGDKSRYLVLDTYGELGGVFGIADIVVIGGGFDKLGGQNLIQPLALGKPVLHGPYMFNFREVAGQSVDIGASKICEDSASLQSNIKLLLENEHLRIEMSGRATALVQNNLGASDRYAKVVLKSIQQD